MYGSFEAEAAGLGLERLGEFWYEKTKREGSKTVGSEVMTALLCRLFASFFLLWLLFVELYQIRVFLGL